MTYTPSTEEVRIKYRLVSGVGAVDAHDEFGRWLAETIRQAKEQAWNQGQASGISFQAGAPYETNPYEKETK